MTKDDQNSETEEEARRADRFWPIAMPLQVPNGHRQKWVNLNGTTSQREHDAGSEGKMCVAGPYF